MSAGTSGFYGPPQRAPLDYATRAPMFHDESNVLRGGSLTRTATSSQKYQVYVAQSSPALGDLFTNACHLRAGVYTFNVLGVTDPAAGMVQWTLDGDVMVARQDWYSASRAYNVVKTAVVTVRTSGPHILRGQVVDKNGSATGYTLYLTKLYFTPRLTEGG